MEQGISPYLDLAAGFIISDESDSLCASSSMILLLARTLQLCTLETSAAATRKPEKNQACTGFEPMTSEISLECFTI